MKKSEQAMFAGIAMNLTTEKLLRWQRSSMFLVLHSTGLVFTLTQPGRDFRFFLIAGFVGLLFAGIWMVILWRTNKWVMFWQNRLAALEKSEPDENQVQIFSGEEFKVADHQPTFNMILWILAALISIVWFGIFVAGLVYPINPIHQ